MSAILDDACRVGDFAVLDARYGHYRDRYYRAVYVGEAPAEGDALAFEQRRCWCAFNRASEAPGFTTSSTAVPRVRGVVPAEAARGGGRGRQDDALFLAIPWFVPLKDLELLNWQQRVPLDEACALWILLRLLDALAADAPPRMPFVDASTVGVTAAGAPLFFGWRAIERDAQSAEAFVGVVGAVRELTQRHLFSPATERGPLAEAVAAALVDAGGAGGRYRASWFAEAADAVERTFNGGGRTWALARDDAEARLGGIVRGLFADRIREHDELDEELALVPLDELRALPPPR